MRILDYVTLSFEGSSKTEEKYQLTYADKKVNGGSQRDIGTILVFYNQHFLLEQHLEKNTLIINYVLMA